MNTYRLLAYPYLTKGVVICNELEPCLNLLFAHRDLQQTKWIESLAF